MRLNFIDKAILFLNPTKGAERLRARILNEQYLSYARKIDAGSKGRRASGWKTSTKGPNMEMMNNIQLIRDRARDLFINNPDSNKAVKVIVSNTVGTGIRPTYNPEGSETPKKNDRVKKILLREWKNWAGKTHIDFHKKLNFYGIQKQVFHTVVTSGSAIVRVRRKSKGFPFALQVFEPEILDHNKDINALPGGGYIQGGIEFDNDGLVVAYWLYDRNPFDTLNSYYPNSSRIPAFDSKGIPNIIHVYEQTRPGQSDGLPFGLSAFLTLRDLDIFEDAELMKQQVSACHAAFVTDVNPEVALSGITRDPSTDQYVDRIEPAMITNLPIGKDIKFSNPPTVTGGSEYTKSVRRKVAGAYGVTYEAMTGDLSNANFSSLKAGNNEFKKLVADWQDNILIIDLCDPVWNLLLWGCYMKGLINLDLTSEDPSFQYPVSWTPPALSMVDPTKEVPALIKSVRAGLQSWQDAQRSLGNDPEETLKELVSDFKAFQENNLVLDSNPASDANRTNIPPQPSG